MTEGKRLPWISPRADEDPEGYRGIVVYAAAQVAGVEDPNFSHRLDRGHRTVPERGVHSSAAGNVRARFGGPLMPDHIPETARPTDHILAWVILALLTVLPTIGYLYG